MIVTDRRPIAIGQQRPAKGMDTMAIRRILVPTDFSATASRALELAIELGAPARAEIVLLHVVEPIHLAAPELYGPAPARVLDYVADQERWAQAELAKIAKRLRGRRVGVHVVVQVGSAYRAILDVAEHLRVGLVVMGTQGRTGISHLLMGSVAEKVVRLAPCPVVTIGPKRPTAKRARRTRSPSRPR